MISLANIRFKGGAGKFLALVGFGLLVFLGNFEAFLTEHLVRFDYVTVGMFTEGETLNWLKQVISRRANAVSAAQKALFFEGIIIPFSATLAKIIYLFLFFAPLALVLRTIGSKVWSFSADTAVFWALLVFVFPHQWEIPVFISGFGIVLVSFFSLLTFFFGREYGLVGKNRYLFYSLASAFLAVLSYELSFFLLTVVVGQLIIFHRQAHPRARIKILWGSIFFIALSKALYIKLFAVGKAARPVANPVDAILERLGEAIYVTMPPLPGDPFSALLALAIIWCLLFLMAFVRFRKTSGSGRTCNSFLRSAFYQGLFFGFAWYLAALFPFIVLQEHNFSNRYGFAANIGLALLISTLFQRFIPRRWPRVLLLLLVFIWFAHTHRETYLKKTGRSHRIADRIARDMRVYTFPRDAQLLVVAPGAGIHRISWRGSSGFLRYYLKNNTLSGRVGREQRFHNPLTGGGRKFRKWGTSMTGFLPGKPLFLFEDHKGKFKQRKFLLQFKKDGNWNLIRLHLKTGRPVQKVSGRGKKELTQLVKKMNLAHRDIIGL